jgi:CheY-like chemotaxis protein
MAQRSRRKAAKRKTARESVPPRFRVLVVDDAEGIRTYLANLLEVKGFDVDTAEDGRRALALLEGGAAPDVIVLDVMMPGVDGLEALKRIREFDADVPVIMLSVVGKASTIVKAMKLGASDYLNKPFEEEEFEITLAKVLEKLGGLGQRSHEARAEPARAGGRDRCHDPDPGRERHRQGGGGAHPARRLEPREAELRQGELRGAADGPARERALRLREGRLHRRHDAQAGQVRAGPPRHDFPR